MAPVYAQEQAAALLGRLISHRTDNPGGDEMAICTLLGAELRSLGADDVDIVSVPRSEGGQIGAYTWARFGTPNLLINAHVDTVPPQSGWTRDPFAAELTADRVIGLGACDTKGAIAAILVALARVTPRDVAILFSGDEEVGTSCMSSFLASQRHRGIARAIVCEPTSRAAGIGHRGIATYRARAVGPGGHSSRASALPNPIVHLARLAVSIAEIDASYASRGHAGMKGLCTNVAKLEGGVAANVVADQASLLWSLRPPPRFDLDRYQAAITSAAAAVDTAIVVTPLMARPALECAKPQWFEALVGPAVRDYLALDFWTEAALLSASGIDAIVVGPGDIAQAHTADEYVTRADLEWAVELFTAIFAGTTL